MINDRQFVTNLPFLHIQNKNRLSNSFLLYICTLHMEPFIVDVEPTEETHFSLSSHEGEEFIYVMEGTIEVCHGKKCHLIKAGDSIYYDSIVPHHVHGYQGQAAKILAVIYTPI